MKIENLITEEELISRSKEFEAAIKDPGSKHPLRDLCVRKAEESRYVLMSCKSCKHSSMFERSSNEFLLSGLRMRKNCGTF